MSLKRLAAAGGSAVLSALVLAACGGGSPASHSSSVGSTVASSSSVAGSTSAQVSPRATAGSGAGASLGKGAASELIARGDAPPDPVHRHHKAVRGRRPYTGTDDDEKNATGAKPFNPCSLVRRAEATTIVQGRITFLHNAPLGPTCVYGVKGMPRLKVVTLSVETTNLATLLKHRKTVAHLKLRGRNAYCVNYGSLAMQVGLPGGRVLSVTAPCPIAARFASLALRRL